MEADDESTEEDMSMVVHDTNKLRFEVKLRLSPIEKLLATNLPNEPPPSSPSPSVELQEHQAPCTLESKLTVTFVCEDTTMRNARKSRMSMSVSNH